MSSAYNEKYEKPASAERKDMKIGELAKATHTQVETIRYYEREGLLPETARTEGNYRVYDSAHVDRLSFIRHCRGLDMTLDEIRVLLRFKDSPHENCAQVNDLLDEHIGANWVAQQTAGLAIWLLAVGVILDHRRRTANDSRP